MAGVNHQIYHYIQPQNEGARMSQYDSFGLWLLKSSGRIKTGWEQDNYLKEHLKKDAEAA